jgi:hypothetical protein
MLVVAGYLLVPYHADKYYFFVDLNDMGISQIPFKYISHMISMLTLFFVFNSGRIGFLWHLVSGLLPEHSRKKI